MNAKLSCFRVGVLAVSAALLLARTSTAAPDTLPGINVHLVRTTQTGRFWRGSAPLPETLEALAASAHRRHTSVTVIDLRYPVRKMDEVIQNGRLRPWDEVPVCQKLGLRYLTFSEFRPDLPAQIAKALAQGDVYLHCMYGKNRTGFAVARYACANNLVLNYDGLGEGDVIGGVAFQRKMKP